MINAGRQEGFPTNFVTGNDAAAKDWVTELAGQWR